MTIKGSLQVSIAIVKAFWQIFGPKFSWITWLAYIGVSGNAIPDPYLPTEYVNFMGQR